MVTPLHVIFYLFAFIALVSALGVISARNPVHSVLSLVVTFFAMAVNWMLLRAEFLSLILILVYVGAVMTLFLFVLMMLNIDREDKGGHFIRYLPFGILVVLALTALMIIAVGPDYFGLLQMPSPSPESADYSNLHALGMLLYNDFVYPFEIAGVLLLAAIIAAISLTFRGPIKRKVQDISDQIASNPANSVRMIKMKTEARVKDQRT